MPPKKTTETSEPAEGPRRSGRVAAQPAPKKEEPVAPAKKPASKAKAPAAKSASKPEATEATKAPAKAPASKKRPAEDETAAKAPASKKTKEDDSAKPKSTKSTAKPASKAAAEKPASKKPASTKAAADKPASKAAAADKPASKAASTAKPASKKPASKAADKPKSTAKPKSKKVGTIAEENEDVDMETEGKTKAEKKEIEAAHEGSDADQSGALKEGETLPKITLKDNQDQDVEVNSLITADHGVIFFTYPKANTPGCTVQACNFRDSFPDFESAGYKVYGLSTDSPTQQESWNTKEKFGYPLLSDPKSELIKKLGAFAPPKNTVRAHFIFEKGTGKLLESKLKVKPAEDAQNCLAFIKKHHS